MIILELRMKNITLFQTYSKQFKVIQESGLLELNENTCLQNPLCCKHATKEQQHDLLAFRDVGQEEFTKYIDYYILRKSSLTVSQRKRKLATFNEIKKQ